MNGWTKLHAKAVESEDVAAVIDADPEAWALFTLMIARAGVWGRYKANPRLLKAAVAPLVDRLTPERIAEALHVLEARGMIVRYAVEGQEFVALTHHFDYNEKQTWHRVGKPDLPAPPDFIPPASLLEYLRKVGAGDFKGKDLAEECAKFGVSEATVSGTTPRDYSQGLLPGTTPKDYSQGTPHTRRRETLDVRPETGETTNDPNDKGIAAGPRSPGIYPLEIPAEEQATPVAPVAPRGEDNPKEPVATNRDLRPEQQLIQDAWEAIGQEGVATDPPGSPRKLYSGLMEVVKTHGEARVRDWIAYLRREQVRPPDGAAPWLWFCAEFRRAMNQPWTWDGSRKEKPRAKSADEVIWSPEGVVDFSRYVA